MAAQDRANTGKIRQRPCRSEARQESLDEQSVERHRGDRATWHPDAAAIHLAIH
jgi:hypothetical protein